MRAGTFLSPVLKMSPASFVLENRRHGGRVALTIEAAFDSTARRHGLLGRDSLPPGQALVIAPCSAVHTFFMRFPIDVVFVKRDGRVAKVRKNMRPWRMAAAFGAMSVVEFAAGTAAAVDIRVGDQLEFVRQDG